VNRQWVSQGQQRSCSRIFTPAAGYRTADVVPTVTNAIFAASGNGIRLPSKRRAYTRGPDRRPILDMLMVSIDISDVSLTQEDPNMREQATA
jgi:hypothetical protein